MISTGRCTTPLTLSECKKNVARLGDAYYWDDSVQNSEQYPIGCSVVVVHVVVERPVSFNTHQVGGDCTEEQQCICKNGMSTMGTSYKLPRFFRAKSEFFVAINLIYFPAQH